MKVATKHDIEAILNWCKKYEKEAREKHKNKLINDEENVWSSFHFGYAEGINFVLDYLEKIIWSENELKSEQNKVAVEKLGELETRIDLLDTYRTSEIDMEVVVLKDIIDIIKAMKVEL